MVFSEVLLVAAPVQLGEVLAVQGTPEPGVGEQSHQPLGGAGFAAATEVDREGGGADLIMLRGVPPAG